MGILQLAKRGIPTKYETAGMIWTFPLKKPRGESAEALHLKVAVSKKKIVSTDTIVTVGGSHVTRVRAGGLKEKMPSKRIDVDLFDSRLFIFLNPGINSVQSEDGELILALPEAETNLRSKRLGADNRRAPLYVRGLFINEVFGIRTPVNLFRFDIDRDRNAVADRYELQCTLAEIWSSALLKKGEAFAPVRDRFISLAQESVGNQTSLEQGTMADMGSDVADSLFCHLKEVKGDDIFPIEQHDVAAKEIVYILKKKPYECNQPFLDLLSKSDHVTSVDDAQRKAFKEGCASPEATQKHELALRLSTYCRKACSIAEKSTTSPLSGNPVSVSIRFLAKTDVRIDGLLDDLVLYVSGSLILEPACHSACSKGQSELSESHCTCGLIALVTMAEREFGKSKIFARSDFDKDELKFITKQFLAEHVDRTFSTELLQPQLHLSFAGPDGVEFFLLQAKARGLVTPERYIISLRRHSPDPASGSGLSAHEVGDDQDQTPAGGSLAVSSGEDSAVEVEKDVVPSGDEEHGCLRHKVGQLDKSSVFSFAVTALFDKEKEDLDGKQKAITESLRFYSVPSTRSVVWSEDELPKHQLTVPFGSAPLFSRIAVQIQDKASSVSGERSLATGIAQTSFLSRRGPGLRIR